MEKINRPKFIHTADRTATEFQQRVTYRLEKIARILRIILRSPPMIPIVIQIVYYISLFI